MLTFVGDGENRQRLEDDHGRVVGWIRGRTVVFSIFASEDEATRAALPAAETLARILRRVYPGWPHHDPAERELRVVRDGGIDWIAAGPIPLGRLLRPLADGREGKVALEFILPSYASPAVIRSCACALHAALFSHSGGVRSPSRVDGAPRSGLPFTDEPIRVA